MDTVQNEKLVYTTGQNLGAILASNAAPTQEPPAEQPPASTTTVDTNGQLQTLNQETSTQPAAATETPAAPATQQPPVEDNVSQFAIPDFSTPEQPAQAQAAPVVPELKIDEVIKKFSREDILKAAGLSDFAIEMDTHLKNGGNAVDYIQARAFDWNKVSDVDVIKNDMRSQFPNFTSQEIDRRFNRKYGLPEGATDEEKEDALLELKADAHQKRQQEITKQSNFKIPAPIQIQAQDNKTLQEQQALSHEAEQQALQWYANHEATKNLMTSKRVALELGENVKFNISVDKPESLMKVVTDADVWQKVTSTPQGEPDVELLQEIALFATNRKKFKTDIFNYGKQFGKNELIAEGQNAQRPTRTLPGQPQETEKDAWKNAKSGKGIG